MSWSTIVILPCGKPSFVGVDGVVDGVVDDVDGVVDGVVDDVVGVVGVVGVEGAISRWESYNFHRKNPMTAQTKTMPTVIHGKPPLSSPFFFFFRLEPDVRFIKTMKK